MKSIQFYRRLRAAGAISLLSLNFQAQAFDLKLLPAPSGGYTMIGNCDVGYMVQVTAHLVGQPLVPGVTFFKHQQLCGLTSTVPTPPTQAIYFNHPGPKFVFSSKPPKPQPAQLKPGTWVFEAQESGPKGIITFPAFKVAIP